MSNILYKKLERQYSNDGGLTWTFMDIYKVGEVLENPSECDNTSTLSLEDDGTNKYLSKT